MAARRESAPTAIAAVLLRDSRRLTVCIRQSGLIVAARSASFVPSRRAVVSGTLAAGCRPVAVRLMSRLRHRARFPGHDRLAPRACRVWPRSCHRAASRLVHGCCRGRHRCNRVSVRKPCRGKRAGYHLIRRMARLAFLRLRDVSAISTSQSLIGSDRNDLSRETGSTPLYRVPGISLSARRIQKKKFFTRIVRSRGVGTLYARLLKARFRV
jgi:hypothetical protein